MASGANIGMMDPAFFVGRRAILEWLNGTFMMNLSKIEETASGAVACQLLDALYPGDVPMQKVRWDAKSPHEFIDNYKVIQAVFEKKGIDKHLDVEKLMRAKYQDNLENMQWFKSFFERNYLGNPYDPIARRAKGRGADAVPAFALDAARRGPINPSASQGPPDDPGVASGAGGGYRAPGSRSSSGLAGSASSAGALGQQSRVGAAAASAAAGSAAGVGGQSARRSTAALQQPAPGLGRQGAGGSPLGPAAGSAASAAVIAGLQGQLEASHGRINELTAQVADMRLSVESLEKERDFYFAKLRDVEILLQSYSGPDRPTVDALFKILYATDDEDFVAADQVQQQGQPGQQEEGGHAGDGGDDDGQ